MLYLSMLWRHYKYVYSAFRGQRPVVRRLNKKQLPRHATRMQRVDHQDELGTEVSELDDLEQKLSALEKRLEMCKQSWPTGKLTKKSVRNQKTAEYAAMIGYTPTSPTMPPPQDST